MRIRYMLACMAMLLFSSVAYAQTGSVSGTVTDATTGETLPRVNVLIVELTRGVATDIDGKFEISGIPHGTYILRVSFIGYTTVERQITISATPLVANIQMNVDTRMLDNLIVTAFGVSRDEKSLGYAIQQVDGDKVSRIDQGNVASALAGKVAGIQVIGSSGANIGGSEKIRIRGTNGLADGQPLFVVDGTPLSNTSFSSSAVGRDYGNLVSDLNLKDVESITVLKGAAASAMFGNRASNGVILITTKKGTPSRDGSSFSVNYSNSTLFESVYILPEYQDEYAGGYTQNWINALDPRDGKTYRRLNMAADESWGPKMDGTLYRPWWSWFDHDFDGDGQSDYGKEVPLTPQPDNVRNFFEDGVRFTNNLSIDGGSSNTTYRLSLGNTHQKGVMPNSDLDRTNVSFNGSLAHNNKIRSNISFNYVNTQGFGRPAQGYSPLQGNPLQSFNQWFQRQVDMEKLKQYRTSSGLIASWNIRSHTDTRPLYWDSPYFTVMENVATDDRNRVFGNYGLTYQVTPELEVTGKIHLDSYDMVTTDRVATGGLEQDYFGTNQYTQRHLNYEISGRYLKYFDNFSFDAFAGGNLRHERYNRTSANTVGGLSTANYFNIAASIDRPNVSNYFSEKKVTSLYGTASLGWNEMLFLDGSLRNDWSSTLPENDNSYLYYGLSTSFVFTELALFRDQDFLSFGKLRASIAQVGDDIGPYQIYQTFSNATPYGSKPGQTVPNTLINSALRPAISSDYEFGVDLRFLSGRLRADINYYNSVRKDEILSLTVPGSSGYSTAIVNAGKFTTDGWELSLSGTPVDRGGFFVDMGINFATANPVVNELAEGLTARQLEAAYFGLALFAKEGQKWGTLTTTGGYGGFLYHENGGKIVGASGLYERQTNVDLGNILPDFTGGFNFDMNYKNFSLSAFLDFQKGGQFYSISKMFNAYSGLGKETVGNNPLGNPIRNPIVNKSGQEVDFVKFDDAAPTSGGVLVEGVDANGNPVKYLTDALSHFGNLFYIKEAWLFDASYIKLREVKLTWNVPNNMLSKTPVKRAAFSIDLSNPLLLYASTSGVDPSTIQNGTAGFSFWEGGTLPGTRSIGFNINLGF